MSMEDSSFLRPELSQALCTIVQVAIVDLLSTWKVQASVVVGHSSGEIAAAYASGAVLRESAWMIAYFRGLAVANTGDLLKAEGSMVAVQATPTSLTPLLEQHNFAHAGDQVVIACYNSTSNFTLSGSRDGINQLTTALTDAKIAFKLLKVNVAYHSSQMEPFAAVYGRLLPPIESGEWRGNQPHFVSTVTGKLLDDTSALRTPEYWMQNLTAPVQFSSAITEIYVGAQQTTSTMAEMFVEIGPHSTLRSPIKDILTANGRDIDIVYVSVLVCNRAADVTALECAGKLYSAGSPVDLVEVNGSQSSNGNLVTTLPPYPFNDKTKY